MKAVVTGMIATYPVGGVLWDYGQYVLGLERMGFDVTYLEDTGLPVFDPSVGAYRDDSEYGVDFLRAALPALSPTLAARWHVRTADGRCHGIEEAALVEAVADADVFINVSGGTLLRPPYRRCKRKVFVDTDPGRNHFHIFPYWDSKSAEEAELGWRGHDVFLTYAERLGSSDCPLPALGVDWRPTRPPVVTDCWGPEAPGRTWTTVLSWKRIRQSLEHDGVVYGCKDTEFERIETLPAHVPVDLEVAAGGRNAPRERWRALGWSVTSSQAVSATHEDYRSYIQRSRGEFSVAKNVYAGTRSGWFSCRSVCYLAAGRPAVLQDTGFSDRLPVGEGLLAFSNLDEAVGAIHAVEADYGTHVAAARGIARDHFDAGRVLADLLESSGVG